MEEAQPLFFKEIGQMLNYLRITGLRVGLIINFKHRRIETRRVVL